MRNLTFTFALIFSCFFVQQSVAFANIIKIAVTHPDSTSPSSAYSFVSRNYTARLASDVTASETTTSIRAEESTVEAIEETVLSGNMILVEQGAFAMGCISEKGDCWENEKPIQSVTVNSFYISRYEVTQELWRQVMGSNPAYFQNCSNCPVEQVTWDEVQQFIAKLNQHTGKKYRLPTEAEWEYAAREGGQNIKYANGDDVANVSAMNYNTQFSVKTTPAPVNFKLTTVPVGSTQPNALGLYDMSGNVWEWCSDNYQKYGESATNLTGSTLNIKAMRGGSWKNPEQFCRTTSRGKELQNKGNMYIGFRLALDK